MGTTIKSNWPILIAGLHFLLFTIYWIFINFLYSGENRLPTDLYTVTYGSIAIWGGIWGILAAKEYGYFQSIVGKAILMFSFGLFAQEFGQLAYTFYIYLLGVEVPYPSIGDIGYFSSILFYMYGVLLLGKASGVKLNIKAFIKNPIVIVIPLIILSLSYYFFLSDYEYVQTNPIVLFLDFGYPLGQSLYLSLAFLVYLLSRKILGGLMKGRVLFVLFALSIQYFSDYIFLYQSSRGTWQIGGINDYMYLISYFVMTLALLNLRYTAKQLKVNK